MDQLEIYNRLQKMLGEHEKSLEKHYTHLENRVIKTLQDSYIKYGNTMAEYQKYNRLEVLKKQIDNAATSQYKKILQDVSTSQEVSFDETYLLYAYLIYMYFSSEDGNLLSITSSAAKTSAIIALIYLLLRSKKKVRFTFMDEVYTTTMLIFEKHKNDYVYNVYMDVISNLKKETDLTNVIRQVKNRTESAKKYGMTKLRDLLNEAVNFAQDKIYDQLAKSNLIDIKKMWLSMRDTQVRDDHRKLDSQIADDEGYFHYAGDKARLPGTWTIPRMNYGCRCKIFLSFNGKVPRFSRIYDYQDEQYQHNLISRVEELMPNRTYLQALKQAQDEIKPPKVVAPYMTFEDWFNNYGDLN